MLQFRSNGLYSPAAASDSSGFSSEHFTSHSTFNPAFRPPGGLGYGGLERSMSPQIPHSYHNPSLMASPYSTLPRRPGSSTSNSNGGQRGHHPPIMASTVGRNSPLLELTGGSYSNRSSSLGRNSSLLPTASEAAANANKRPSGLTMSVRTPLLDDDRESCV